MYNVLAEQVPENAAINDVINGTATDVNSVSTTQ